MLHSSNVRTRALTRHITAVALAAAAVATMSACAPITPTGPTVMALPEKGKPLATFQKDDYDCRGYAYQAINGTAAEQAAQRSSVNSTVAGTVGGAAVGALLGAGSGHAGQGAAIGAGAGLLLGSTIGADTAANTSEGLQARYDVAYAQCMASKGDNVETPRPVATQPATVVYYGAPVVVGPGPGPAVGPWWGW